MVDLLNLRNRAQAANQTEQEFKPLPMPQLRLLPLQQLLHVSSKNVKTRNKIRPLPGLCLQGV
jgi:hypothetical protein